MTYHWYVPPGRHLYTQQLGRRREVRVHFIGSHLHPYGEYVEIKDVTDNKVIFRSEATPLKGQPGIAELSAFSSIKGVTLHNDHDYAITTQYNNTTDHPIDAMAILYLYFHNKRLEDQIKQLFKS
jgi:hypothetical protein